MTRDVRNYIQKLNALFIMAEAIKDEELKSHMAKYLCVRTSGLIELYLKTQIGEYVAHTSSKEIQKYVNQKFKTFTNVDNDKLTKMLESFSEVWLKKYQDGMTEEMISALNSIVGNRNNIAHGHTDSISLTSMQKYYARVLDIINLLDKIIKH